MLKNLAVIIYPALLAGYYIVYTYREPIDFAGNTVHCLLVKQPGYVLLFHSRLGPCVCSCVNKCYFPTA